MIRNVDALDGLMSLGEPIDLLVIDPALRLSNHFAAPRTVHSAKPDRFYEIVERVSPEPRLELFARRRRYGWDVWGNEAPTEQASQAILDLEGVA